MLVKRLILSLVFLLSFSAGQIFMAGTAYQDNSRFSNQVKVSYYFYPIYETLTGNFPKPSREVFNKSLAGFFNLASTGSVENNLLTIIDFSLSSNSKRMWIVDMNKLEIIHHTIVAHGRNSGDEFARKFSNRPSSYKSSLGFYLTGDIYYGMHGMSLYLDGMEPGVNDKARKRTIVMHSAGYVSEKFIRSYGRLGRSFGCPSIPVENHEKIISMLSGRSCLYIHYPKEQYLKTSDLLNTETTIEEVREYLGNMTHWENVITATSTASGQ